MPTVRSVADLSRALGECKGGETISLAGTFNHPAPNRDLRNRRFATPVVIDLSQAVINGIWYFRMLEGVEFRGGTFTKGRLRIDGAERVTFRNMTFLDGMGISIVGGAKIAVTGCKFERCGTGVGLSTVAGYVVDRNIFLSARSDGIQAAGGSDGRITGNVMRGMQHIPPAHPDGIQMWRMPPDVTRNLLIEDNVIEGDCQGIFLPGPPGSYENVTLRRNKVFVSAPNGIYCGGMKGLVLEDNEIVAKKNAKHGSRYFIAYCEDVKWLGRNTLNGQVKKDVVSRRLADYEKERERKAARAKAKAKSKAEP